MTGSDAARIGNLIVRAGWAPLTVFITHLVVSYGLDGYTLFPSIDIPIHFLGGFAMAYFLSRCFAALPDRLIARDVRKLTEFVVVASLTTTVTIFWEFAEFTSDALLGTHTQQGLGDTMLDMALGMLGGVCFLLMALRQGSVGEVIK